MRKQKTKLAFTLLLILETNYIVCAEENIAPANEVVTKLPSKKETTIQFSIKNSELEQLSKSDQILWIEVDKNKHLILKYDSKSNKQRGNVLLLHTSNENPNHIRLMQPLTQQLANLGWNLFIPNIARPDYPEINTLIGQNESAALSEKNDSTKELTNPDSAQEKTTQTTMEVASPKSAAEKPSTNHFFDSSKSYQKYYINLCSAIFEQTNIVEQPMILIVIQDAAYWSLPCLKLAKNEVPIVFLQATLPKDLKNDLDDVFSKQTTPFYYFEPNNIQNTPFIKAFKKNLWSTKHQRSNIGLLPRSKLEIEDTFVARMITGWIEKQRKPDL